MKKIKGEFIEDIYSATSDYPLIDGESINKSDIDSMFELSYKKGTRLVLEEVLWYTEDGDGGWHSECAFAKKNIKRIK